MEQIILGEKSRIEGNGREIEALVSEKFIGFVSSPVGSEIIGDKYVFISTKAIAYLTEGGWIQRSIGEEFKGFSLFSGGLRYTWNGFDWTNLYI